MWGSKILKAKAKSKAKASASAKSKSIFSLTQKEKERNSPKNALYDCRVSAPLRDEKHVKRYTMPEGLCVFASLREKIKREEFTQKCFIRLPCLCATVRQKTR